MPTPMPTLAPEERPLLLLLELLVVEMPVEPEEPPVVEEELPGLAPPEPVDDEGLLPEELELETEPPVREENGTDETFGVLTGAVGVEVVPPGGTGPGLVAGAGVAPASS